MGAFIKKLLFRFLSFENYLYVLSRFFFLSYDLGFLKSNPSYDYHYYLKQIIKPGDTVVDIGANMGYYSRNFSKWVGSNGEVHAYEPVRPIYNVLKRNLKGSNNIFIHPYALGEEEKKIKIGNDTFSSRGYIASGSNFVVDEKDHSQHENTFEAEMKIASKELGRLDSIDFIKCDVEGYEYYILSQIIDVLKQSYPTILLESHGENRDKVIELFTNLGYNGFLLIDGKLVALESTNDRHKDMLFIHP